MQQKQAKDRPGLKLTDHSRLGDIAEHVVITQALIKGAEVYKSVTCTGKTDVIISHNDQLIHIDVKTEEWDPRSNTFYSPGKAGATKHRALVNPKTWKVRWPVGKAPQGWELFWY